jgi:DNA-binding NarL/FixJ family response regulator
VTWRTKVSGAPAVEHPSRAIADAHIDELRRRYHAGARALRIVRLLDPEGGVRLIDFAQEAKAAATALRDVERATEVRDRAVREATERWEVVVARAVSLGQTVEDVAAAAGVTPRDVRAIVRRRA